MGEKLEKREEAAKNSEVAVDPADFHVADVDEDEDNFDAEIKHAAHIGKDDDDSDSFEDPNKHRNRDRSPVMDAFESMQIDQQITQFAKHIALFSRQFDAIVKFNVSPQVRLNLLKVYTKEYDVMFDQLKQLYADE
jgi:hypothetical protein